MSVDLSAAAADYLRARRARGYRLVDHAWLITSFLDHLAARGAARITVADAVAFATAPTGSTRRWHAARLSVLRGFATYLHGLDPDAADLIPDGLITARTTRPTPYPYSTEQVAELTARAAGLSPARLGATMGTFVGLIAATGLRSSEAVGLDVTDLDLDQALMTVTGKYARQRVLPLHPTTVAALAGYLDARSGWATTPAAGPLLLGHTGNRLNVNQARAVFRAVTKECALPDRPGCGPARLHDLRHRFAVQTLIDAHRDGVDVDARITALAAYLGHANPANTYWYLTASPELMHLVADRARTTPVEAGRR